MSGMTSAAGLVLGIGHTPNTRPLTQNREKRIRKKESTIHMWCQGNLSPRDSTLWPCPRVFDKKKMVGQKGNRNLPYFMNKPLD